jgi:hypothetical protein
MVLFALGTSRTSCSSLSRPHSLKGNGGIFLGTSSSPLKRLDNLRILLARLRKILDTGELFSNSLTVLKRCLSVVIWRRRNSRRSGW